jgi:hypothetical protein
MKLPHDKGKKHAGRVSEPVQVYLSKGDQERLARLTAALGSTKSDVLRQGLAALEAGLARARTEGSRTPPLPTFKGKGLQPGVDLDDTASLLDLMDEQGPR